MKSMIAAGALALLAAVPALADDGYMVMCKVDMFPYSDPETEVTLQWQQLVACANAYRTHQMTMAAATRQSGGSGMDTTAAPRSGAAFALRVRPAAAGKSSYACPASGTDIAGSEAHGTDCLPGGRN